MPARGLLGELYAKAYRVAWRSCLTGGGGHAEEVGARYAVYGLECSVHVQDREKGMIIAGVEAEVLGPWVRMNVYEAASASRPPGTPLMAAIVAAALARVFWETWPQLVPVGAVPALVRLGRLPRRLASMIRGYYGVVDEKDMEHLYAVAWSGALVLPYTWEWDFERLEKVSSLTYVADEALASPIIWRRPPGECVESGAVPGRETLVCRVGVYGRGPYAPLPLLGVDGLYVSVAWEHLDYALAELYGLGGGEAARAAGVLAAIGDILS